jgi:hypothetical protein
LRVSRNLRTSFITLYQIPSVISIENAGKESKSRKITYCCIFSLSNFNSKFIPSMEKCIFGLDAAFFGAARQKCAVRAACVGRTATEGFIHPLGVTTQGISASQKPRLCSMEGQHGTAKSNRNLPDSILSI